MSISRAKGLILFGIGVFFKKRNIREELLKEWKVSIIAPIYTKGNKTDCSSYKGIPVWSTTYKTLFNILLSRSTPYAEKVTGIIIVHFDATVQLLIMYFAFVK